MKSACSPVTSFVLLLVAFSTSAQTNKITPAEAKDHVGETRTVCGKVVSTHFASKSKGEPTFLNLDEPYPKEVFTILIWGSDRGKFGTPETKYKDAAVCVTGKITSHREKPEIIATLALRTYTSGEYRIVSGQLKRSKKFLAIRGLNLNHNHDLKNIFKGAATRAASTAGPFQEFYQACLARGMKPHLARLTLARKIAAITLLVWKKGARFDAEHLKQQAA